MPILNIRRTSIAYKTETRGQGIVGVWTTFPIFMMNVS